MKTKILCYFIGEDFQVISEKLPESQFVFVQNQKSLLQKLKGQQFDLLILGEQEARQVSATELAARFNVPVIASEKVVEPNFSSVFPLEQINHLPQQTLEMILKIWKRNRGIDQLWKSLLIGKEFEKELRAVDEDCFVATAKTFLQKNFKMSDCLFVNLTETEVEVPLALAVINSLEKQSLNQRDLILKLKSFQNQEEKSGHYEIWKNSEKQSLVIISLGEQSNLGPCLVLNSLPPTSLRKLKRVLPYFSDLLRNRWRLCQEVSNYKSQVYIDGLTGLFNQQYLHEALAMKIEEYNRYKTPFSVLFLDVDFFKKINDTMGHVVGSEVLRQLGKSLKDTLRVSDTSFRYGGDEFIVLLSHTVGESAEIVAERIRSQIEKKVFLIGGHKINITVSIGLAFFPEHATSALDIIRIADEAMYCGKKQSRNVVYKAS